MLPEDYATLYIQFANAIHKLVPEAPWAGRHSKARLATWILGRRQWKSFVPGPVRGLPQVSQPPAGFHVLFVRALSLHGHAAHAAIGLPSTGSRTSLNTSSKSWKDNGLPPNVPFFMTEGNDLGEAERAPLKARSGWPIMLAR